MSTALPDKRRRPLVFRLFLAIIFIGGIVGAWRYIDSQSPKGAPTSPSIVR